MTSPKPAPKAPRPVAAAAPPTPQWERWYPLLLVVVGLALYWGCLDGPFLFDDADIREPRTSVRQQNWWIILTGPRPLLILSYALNYRFAGREFRAFDFHLVNVVLHLVNVILLWRLLRRIRGLPAPVGWAAPLLFLTSPIQTESVAYISSRSELLAATFYLLALRVFVSDWREKHPWITALVVAFCYGCSVTSKQHALTLPGALLLVDYFFLAERDWRRLRRNWPIYTVLGGLMVVGGFVVVRAVINVPSAGFYLKEVTWKDYLFTQLRMYFLYLRLLAFPFGLNADYDIAPSRTLWQHFSWLALAGIIALLGAALWGRRRWPLVSFGVLFYFLTLFPSSSFYPLLDYAAERRLYLPSIGFLAAALGLAAGRWGTRRELVWGLVATATAYGAGTISRNRVWADPLALWEDTAEKSPGKWRPFANLGREYSDGKQFEKATTAYRRAVELVPPRTENHAELLSNLGSTYNNRYMYNQAVEVYQEALKISPGRPRLLTNLGMAEVRLGRPEGWERFQKAIEEDRMAWEPHMARGNLYYEMQRYDEAIRDYERVLRILPDHPDAQHNLKAARAMKLRRGR